ncbi:MAG: hypothetical protein IJJ47_03975 [Methanosphaera sp.]|nr:hypothetical protein [Methanosphaera sp.]
MIKMVDITEMFRNLNHTIRGKKDTFFLVNDDANEIKQHYDKTYNKTLNIDDFIESQQSKEKFFKNNNKNYGLFVIPDKSVILRDKLPFDTEDYLFRYVDSLKEYLQDLSVILTQDDFLTNDSHINAESYLKIIAYIILQFTNEYDYYFYYTLLKSRVRIESIDFEGDLLSTKNWSYDYGKYHKRFQFIKSTKLVPKDKVTEISTEEIPEEFREFSSVKSRYFINNTGFSDKKALILYDSKLNSLLPVLLSYYREVFFYQDYNYFNKDLVSWFNPDDVIEIRTERYLEKLYYPLIDEKHRVLIPIKAQIEDMIIKGDDLIITMFAQDIRNMPLSSDYEVFIDDELATTGTFKEKNTKIMCDISDKTFEVHEITILIKSGQHSKSKKITTKYKFYEDTSKHFKGLHKTIKGKNNTFFLVNDSNSEIRQHYDVKFKGRFNTQKFIKSQKSKKEFLSKRNIPYEFFVVPDKSILLRDYLPVDTSNMYRYIPEINDYVDDLLSILDVEDYLQNDTHISIESSLKVVPYILSKFHGNTPEYYESLLKKRLKVIPGTIKGNLFYRGNWSYEFDELYDKYAIMKINALKFDEKCFTVDEEEIPEEFRRFSRRKSRYIKNPGSISDKKALVLHGSSAINMQPALTAYYREVFFYWDHSYFNKDIVEWFKPDVVFEFRIERFFEKMYCPIIEEDKNVLMPIHVDRNNIGVKIHNLNVNLFVKDLRGLLVNSLADLYIDEKLVKTTNVVDGNCEFNVNVSEYSRGIHDIKILIKETEYSKFKEINEKVTF